MTARSERKKERKKVIYEFKVDFKKSVIWHSNVSNE